MVWFFDNSSIIWLQETFPWLEWFFKIITFLGNGLFYIILLSIAYWIYRKREAIIGIYVLLTTAWLNFFLKVLIKKPRPPQELRIIEAEGFSTPSGHAQGSTTVYGWIMLQINKIWSYIVTPLLVILICISRVYLGVHYVGDVILGGFIGSFILLGVYFGTPIFLKWFNQKESWIKILIGEIYAIIVFVATFIPAYFVEWPAGDMSNSADIVAVLVALPFIIYVENRWIKMETEKLHWQSIILRLIIGLGLTLGSYFGLSYLFDLIGELSYSLAYLVRFTKYFIIIWLIGAGTPFLFANVKIFSKFRNEKIQKEIPNK
ncbi:MAG: phosphatase PAP2 family protein [Asgard group archaeon]|nr:phosphatase PAP2 family protein [Asgard group archaeon]